MTNTLLLVHVQNGFRQYFPNDMYIPRLVKAVHAKKYQNIVHMTSDFDDDTIICELKGKVHREINWSWGYYPFQFEDESEEEWVIPSSGHEFTWIPPEFRNGFLDNTKIFLGGGADGECLTDMESIMSYMKIPYQRVEGYIYRA